MKCFIIFHLKTILSGNSRPAPVVTQSLSKTWVGLKSSILNLNKKCGWLPSHMYVFIRILFSQTRIQVDMPKSKEKICSSYFCYVLHRKSKHVKRNGRPPTGQLWQYRSWCEGPAVKQLIKKSRLWKWGVLCQPALPIRVAKRSVSTWPNIPIVVPYTSLRTILQSEEEERMSRQLLRTQISR